MAKYKCLSPSCQEELIASEFAELADLKCNKCGGAVGPGVGTGGPKFPSWVKKIIIPVSIIFILIIYGIITGIYCERDDSHDCVDEYSYDEYGGDKKKGEDGDCDIWQAGLDGYEYEIWINDGSSTKPLKTSTKINSNHCTLVFVASQNKKDKLSFKEFRKKYKSFDFSAKSQTGFQEIDYILDVKNGEIKPCFDSIAKIILTWSSNDRKIPLTSQYSNGKSGVIIEFVAPQDHPNANCHLLPEIKFVNNQGAQCEINVQIQGLSKSDFESKKDLEVSITGKEGPWEHKLIWDWNANLIGELKNVWVRNKKFKNSVKGYENNGIETWENACVPWTDEEQEAVITNTQTIVNDYFDNTNDLSIMSEALITSSQIFVDTDCCNLKRGLQPATSVLQIINQYVRANKLKTLPLKVVEIQVNRNSQTITLIKIIDR